MTATSAIAISIAAVLALQSQPLFACGKERWPVKVLTDKMKDRVDPTPVPTSVEKLRLIHPPVNPNAQKDSRYAPTELIVYEVTGVLVYIKHESDDDDYHLVIKGETGQTMIVESPADNCVEQSRFSDEMKAVRKAIDDKLGPISSTPKVPNIAVTVTGVGFFDPLHGQHGVAPNGIELHPILSIDFHRESSIPALRKRLHKKTDEKDR